MSSRLSRSALLAWTLFTLAALAAAAPVALAARFSSEYELFRVPIASWVVFCLSGILLALDLAAFLLWFRVQRLNRDLAEAGQSLIELRSEPLQATIPAICGAEQLARVEFPVIIQVLFSRLPAIEYIHLKPLAGGFSGSTTVLARLQRQPGEPPLPRSFVVKLGDRRGMAGEHGRYLQHVFAFLPQAPRFYQYTERQEWAGIAYEFAGLDLDAEVQSLEQFYRGYAGSEVAGSIGEVFAHLGRAWYQAGKAEPVDLSIEYALLRQKRQQILDSVGEVVDQDDPYHANLSGSESSLRPRLRPRFCPSPDLPWYDPVAFLRTWPRTGALVPIHRSIVHGDLNARNVLVEIIPGGQKRVWFIDFSHTGNGLSTDRTEELLHAGLPISRDHGHTLRDFCRLEADIKFLLTRLHTENDLRLAVEFERTLFEGAGGLAGGPAVPPATEALLDERFKKAWQIVREIRALASRYLVAPDDLRPYYWALLNASLGVLYYSADQFENEMSERQQKRYVLLAAGILCDRIRVGSPSPHPRPPAAGTGEDTQ
jgi:hypothetical protein